MLRIPVSSAFLVVVISIIRKNLRENLVLCNYFHQISEVFKNLRRRAVKKLRCFHDDDLLNKHDLSFAICSCAVLESRCCVSFSFVFFPFFSSTGCVLILGNFLQIFSLHTRRISFRLMFMLLNLFPPLMNLVLGNSRIVLVVPLQ